MLATDLKPETTLLTDRGFAVAMAGVFVPWAVAVLFTAGAWTALHFIAYAVMVLAVGYSILAMALSAAVRTQNIVLAPALGVLTVSALGALWLRLGLPVIWVSILWLVLALAGAWMLWTDRGLWTTQRLAYGRSLVLLSALICLVYFLPSARSDAVHRPDGSFTWMYVDTQWFYSMAANIEAGSAPPTAPGAATKDLLYHFGPYVPAAAISRLTGLDLGDVLVRVTRAASLWALVLASFGLGTLLSLKATAERFGGVMAVAGLFFYGSLLSLFANEVNTSSQVSGAILFTIPGVDVLGQGGPFSHLILGHSELHGLIAITAILGLCILQRGMDSVLIRQRAGLLALPALAVPINSVAALYCVGIAGIVLFWGHLRNARAWLSILLMCCLFLATWKIMGYSQAADTALTTLNRNPGLQWWTLAVGFLIGLGFRIVAFRWISRPFTDPLSALALVSVLGLLLFTLLLQFEHGQQRYGLYFLQSIFSIFAFSRLTYGCWRGAERSRWIAEWLKLARSGMAFFAACGVLLAGAAYVTHRHTGIQELPLKIVLILLTLGLLTGISALMRRSQRVAAVSSAFVGSVLLIGFLAWVTPWLNFGIGRMKMDITIPPGEVQGLARLRQLSLPGDRFATNKHSVDSLVSMRERSYAYGALTQRPVLLEGYSFLEGYSAKQSYGSPALGALLHDNDLMFSTTNPDTLRSIASTYHVRWLVARPGTDISLSRPLPPWLVPQQDSGDLRIYRIN